MEGVRKYLTHKLKLTVNETKSAAERTNRISFLGFIFNGTRIIWSDKAYLEFWRRVRKFTGRNWFVPMKYRLNKLAEVGAEQVVYDLCTSEFMPNIKTVMLRGVMRIR